MSLAKAVYRRIIPEFLRRPLGRKRRALGDRLTRFFSSTPLPPPSLLVNVQMTPWVEEFIRIGSRSASSIEAILSPLLERGDASRVLDFGCGCGRTLLHIRRDWEIHGCDIDDAAIEWLSNAFDDNRFVTNGTSPPLSWPDGHFDAVYAVSVFTHFSEAQHAEWRKELARVLRPGGLLAATTMGSGILSNFPVIATEENRRRLEETGYFFIPNEESFNANAAFHTPGALARMLAPEFDLIATSEQGLDGFQDLSVLRKVQRS